MGILIGPLDREWIKTLLHLKAAIANDNSLGNIEAARKEKLMFSEVIKRFTNNDDEKAFLKAA